jgi:cyanobactin maturation PatA/PatG family protease
MPGARLELLALASAGTSGFSASRRHGTHVTSEIFASSKCGLSGIAPECSGLLIPVFGDSEDGGLIAASQIDLARAIRLAVDRGANVINISGGQLSPTAEAEQFLGDALDYCDQAGVLVVAAAGNNGCECLHVPASIAPVLAVGAFDPATGEPLGFSNWGQAYRSNGILAPGKDIPGAQAGGGLTTRTGTSFAAPIVTGVAALLMSIQLKRGMAVDARAVRAALLKGATRCDELVAEDCRPYLVGRLDVNTSLGLLSGEVDAVEPSQAVAPLHTRGQKTIPALRDVSCAGVISPNAARRGETPNKRMSHEAVSSNRAEIATIGPRSVLLSSSSGSEERIPAILDRCCVGATRLSSSVCRLNRERNEMAHEVNEEIGPSGDHPSGAGVPWVGSTSGERSIRSTGIEASGIAVQEGTANMLPSGVKPSGDCGCGCCGGAAGAQPQLVFALGELGYDLVTEARKDSLWQAVHADPYEWQNLANHLRDAPWDAEAVTWTLRIDATPIYAIQPMGAYASDAYKRLADWLIGQIDERKIERISLPGFITGSTTLTNGITVPVVVPSLRGMFAWDTKRLVESLTQVPEEVAQLTNFLQRVYYDLRNLGQSPQERAKNFAATNAYQAHRVFQDAIGSKYQLDGIDVEKSPICRPDSDCWDVKLTFFDPVNDRAARQVHRFTVDVSDVVPCTVGSVRNWFVR